MNGMALYVKTKMEKKIYKMSINERKKKVRKKIIE